MEYKMLNYDNVKMPKMFGLNEEDAGIQSIKDMAKFYFSALSYKGPGIFNIELYVATGFKELQPAPGYEMAGKLTCSFSCKAGEKALFDDFFKNFKDAGQQATIVLSFDKADKRRATISTLPINVRKRLKSLKLASDIMVSYTQTDPTGVEEKNMKAFLSYMINNKNNVSD